MPFKDPQKRREYVKKWEDAHREERRARGRAYVRANPEKSWTNNIKRLFGLTVDDYQAMFEKQGGRCAICGKHQTEMGRRLYVDHNHTTGKVRALLCQHCNTALGFVDDNEGTLQKMIDYLRRHDG